MRREQRPLGVPSRGNAAGELGGRGDGGGCGPGSGVLRGRRSRADGRLKPLEAAQFLREKGEVEREREKESG